MKRKLLTEEEILQLLHEKEIRQRLREMAEAGVLKVVGHKMEDGQSVPIYAAVPTKEWPPEGRAFMGGEDAIEFAS